MPGCISLVFAIQDIGEVAKGETMRDRTERSTLDEVGAVTEPALNLASIIGLGAMGDFRAALAAMNPDTNVSRPTTTILDVNGRGQEMRRPDGSLVRTYDLGGRAELDPQGRLIRMTDRVGNSFQLTYEGNATQPLRIQGSNGLDFRPDAQTRVTVNPQAGLVEMWNESGTGATYCLNGNSTEINYGHGGRTGPLSRFTTQRSYNPSDGSLTTSVQRDGDLYSEETVTRRDGSGSRYLWFPRGQGGAAEPEMVPTSARFAPGQANPTYTTMENGQVTSHEIRNVREIRYCAGSAPGLCSLAIMTHDGRHLFVSDLGVGGMAAFVSEGTKHRQGFLR